MIRQLERVIAEIHPTRLIKRMRAVPPWRLGLAVCVVGLAGGGLGAGLTWYTTHARQFCLSCHQYQRPEFGQARLHPKSVLCADCHTEGHSILPTRFAAEARNVRVQCQNCHQQVITDEQSHYKSNPLNIRITHASHLKLEGVTCITCHYNVAHDRRVHPTNRPAMTTCFECHQGEQRSCIICHPAGSLPTPPPQARIEPTTCNDCHLDWETNRRVVGGAGFTHDAHLSAGLRCDQCHAAGDRHGQLSLPRDRCWEACHQNRPASHEEDWRTKHGREVKAGAQECGQCHETQFCQRCHGLEMPHPVDWRRIHTQAAARDKATCARCHQAHFCQECHAQSRPVSHVAGWRDAHGEAYRSERQVCAVCHERDFCGRCHEPMPHPTGWARRGHAEAAQQSRKGCDTCHDNQSCLACHGTPLPHGKNWSRQHGGQATTTPGLCAKCHSSGDCQACHDRLRPRSHDQQGWRRSHSAAGQQHADLCSLCHGENGCQKCHGVEMPHPEDWVATHKTRASMAPGGVCFRCHERTTFCADCHPQG